MPPNLPYPKSKKIDCQRWPYLQVDSIKTKIKYTKLPDVLKNWQKKIPEHQKMRGGEQLHDVWVVLAGYLDDAQKVDQTPDCSLDGLDMNTIQVIVSCDHENEVRFHAKDMGYYRWM